MGSILSENPLSRVSFGDPSLQMQLLNVADLGLEVFSVGSARHALHSGETPHNFAKVVSFVQHWIFMEPPSFFFLSFCEGGLYACLFYWAYRGLQVKSTPEFCTLSRSNPICC